MTTLREAAQQALEALESLFTLQVDYARPKQCGDAITALRAALEQPEQKPVAYLQRRFVDNFPAPGYETCEPQDYGAMPVYTHPPRREWRGLTDEERRDIREWKKIQEELGPVWAPMMLYLYLAIEAALRSKNYE
jgi:hypothetical protein